MGNHSKGGGNLTLSRSPGGTDPPVDLEAVNRLIRQMADYEILTDPISIERDLSKAVTYVMTAAGVMEVRKTAFGVSVAKVDKVPGLLTLPAGLILSLQKLSWADFSRIVQFFREVNEQHKAEAFVQVWRHKDGGPYELLVPPQTISGAHVAYTNPDVVLMPGDWYRVMEMHSHNTMSAFFSSVDDSDEAKAESVYGVIGDITNTVPSWKWRCRAGGKFIDLQLTDVVEVPEPGRMVKFQVALSTLLSGKSCKNGVTLDLPLQPFEEVEVPKEWHEALTVATGTTSMTIVQGGGGYNNKRTYKADDYDRGNLSFMQDKFNALMKQPEKDWPRGTWQVNTLARQTLTQHAQPAIYDGGEFYVLCGDGKWRIEDIVQLNGGPLAPKYNEGRIVTPKSGTVVPPESKGNGAGSLWQGHGYDGWGD